MSDIKPKLIRFTTDEAKLIEDEAKRRGKGVSETDIVREAVIAYLLPQSVTMEEIAQRLDRLEGLLQTG